MMGQQPPPAVEVEVLAWLPSCQEDPEFGTPNRQKEYATTLKTEGLHAAVWMYEPSALTTVSALNKEIGLNVNPWVPNMRAYLRDASEHGVVGAALQRFMRLPLPDKARIALHNIRRAIGVVRRDFTTGLLIMVDMELVRFRRYGASAAFLNASVTDLVLALDDPRLLREFLGLVRRTYGLEAGLATYNYGVLVERLQAWRVFPEVIVAPFNSRGYLMNPSKERCERALRTSQIPVLATHIEVDGLVKRQDAVAYLRGLGIKRALASRSPSRGGRGQG
ncbi:MAG: hypothetical protein WBG05_17130 [Thermoanaerobaculia bacterium]